LGPVLGGLLRWARGRLRLVFLTLLALRTCHHNLRCRRSTALRSSARAWRGS